MISVNIIPTSLALIAVTDDQRQHQSGIVGARSQSAMTSAGVDVGIDGDDCGSLIPSWAFVHASVAHDRFTNDRRRLPCCTILPTTVRVITPLSPITTSTAA
jgi:hypothetical protein